MMVFSPLNEEAFDVVQVELGYCKLFKHIIQDFVTRRDIVQIINSGNLPVQATVVAVAQVAPPTFTGAATGTATGTVIPVYNGAVPHPSSSSMIQEKEAIRRAGGVAIEGLTSLG
jgi:hypothetical protein